MTGYSRDAMVHQHLVEACVPEAAQQAVADHMEHVFALPPSDPLASEPGEAFSLPLYRAVHLGAAGEAGGEAGGEVAGGAEGGVISSDASAQSVSCVTVREI